MTQQKRIASLFSQYADLIGAKTSAKFTQGKGYSNEFLRMDFNSLYGGYRIQLVHKNTSESHYIFSSRMSNKEMASFLQGLLEGYSKAKGIRL